MSIKGLIHRAKHIKLSRVATYAGVAALVLLVGSYALWKFGRFFSPETVINSNNPIIKYRTSDHSGSAPSKVALPNNFTDTTLPNYTDNIGSGPTVLTIDGANNVVLPRFQGEVEFR